jgi:hypothetical protein
MDCPAGLANYSENEFGAVVTISVRNLTETVVRRQFTASSHGYLNQNEYILHFGLPADPNPDPSLDVRFDGIVDFPHPAGMTHQVGPGVNSALGNIDLAMLYNTPREITVFNDGTVLINGTCYPRSVNNTPDPCP